MCKNIQTSYKKIIHNIFLMASGKCLKSCKHNPPLYQYLLIHECKDKTVLNEQENHGSDVHYK